MCIIGSRIEEQRRNLSLTQEALSEAVSLILHPEDDKRVTRQLVARWENGESVPKLQDSIALCKIFKCEIGYLIGDYDEPTRTQTDIKEATGLSSEAVQALLRLKNNKDKSDILSQILEHKSLNEFLDAVQSCAFTISTNRYRPFLEEEDYLIANFFNCEPINSRKYLEEYSVSVVQSSIRKIIDDIKQVKRE